MKDAKRSPNPAGRTGKPIILPRSTFEDAVKKIVSTPPPPKEDKPAKKSAKKR